MTPAGNGVYQLTDFKAGVTITSITVPGELDMGLPGYQAFCFVTPGTGDIIPAEAIFKLRQKHREAGKHRLSKGWEPISNIEYNCLFTSRNEKTDFSCQNLRPFDFVSLPYIDPLFFRQ